MRRIVVIVTCGVLVLAACGGGEDAPSAASTSTTTTAAPRTAAEERMISLLARWSLSQDDQSFPIDRASAHCLAEGLVDRFGLAGLVRLGLTSDRLEEGGEATALQLGRADAEGYADVMLRCLDFAASVAAQNPGLSAQSVACLGEKLRTDVEYRDLLVRLMTGEQVTPEKAGAAMAGVAEACLTDEELARLREKR